MILTTLKLKNDLREYSSVKSKISRLLESNELYQLKRGFYTKPQESALSLYSVANLLYGPSYISFESALSYYNLIPERVSTITSATFNKNKSKYFDTQIANFSYLSVPDKVYSLGVDLQRENEQNFLIASPSRALIDTIYKNKYDPNTSDFKRILSEDLRFNLEEVELIEPKILRMISKSYNKRLITRFTDWFLSEVHK